MHQVFDGYVGGEAEGAVAQCHGISQGHDAADNGPGHPLVLFRGALQSFTHSDYFARWFAAGDGPGVRGAHHYALEDGLSADQGFFAALECRQKLYGGQETKIVFKRTHGYWMLHGGGKCHD